jgi:TrmH family RNA methyltransferase
MREKDRLFLVEGVRGVLEALASEADVIDVFHVELASDRLSRLRTAAGAAGANVLLVSDEVMAHLTSTVTPQGVVAVARFVDVALADLPEEPGVVPVLVEVRDPGNAGTILRSADASGAGAVVFSSSSVDVYNPKTVRASAGSLFHLPVVRDAGLRETVGLLRDRGFRILAAAADGETPVDEVDLSGTAAILLGNEARGLGPDAVAAADATVRVPIEGGAESVNLAAAATVILFEAARQRRGGNALAQIVAGAAHDLRSPITAVRGLGSTLLSRWDRLSDEQRLAMLEGVVADANRMGMIVTELVDAARIASRRLRLAPEPTDLWRLAQEGASDFERCGSGAVEARRLDGEEPGPEGRSGPVVWLDPVRIRTVLFALMEAAAWWGEAGPVHVDVGADGGPFLEVWREATSLDPATAAALFHPRKPGSGGGTKVGLYVAAALAQAHGTRIVVGTGDAIRFRLSFPPSSRTG